MLSLGIKLLNVDWALQVLYTLYHAYQHTQSEVQEQIVMKLYALTCMSNLIRLKILDFVLDVEQLHNHLFRP